MFRKWWIIQRRILFFKFTIRYFPSISSIFETIIQQSLISIRVCHYLTFFFFALLSVCCYDEWRYDMSVNLSHHANIELQESIGQQASLVDWYHACPSRLLFLQGLKINRQSIPIHRLTLLSCSLDLHIEWNMNDSSE